ncbi:fasciclin domain-containing protein [Streptomyces sp. NPDC057239]|uniref:fasciclin domain-containing protein n=1 Tax=Streptomyces sp. NPDC057239 TaxID=3346061 RepID=UPI00363E4D5E
MNPLRERVRIGADRPLKKDSPNRVRDQSAGLSGPDSPRDRRREENAIPPGCAERSTGRVLRARRRRTGGGMAEDPVATAASNDPALSTLVTAVKKAGLVDTLNNAEDITVFAPTNDAFAKIPKDTLYKVLADKEQLANILTYHVVGQKLTPEDLGSGSFETLQKSKLTTSGADGDYTVNDSAKVVCGNVKTANANVYIIDTVLMPAS